MRNLCGALFVALTLSALDSAQATKQTLSVPGRKGEVVAFERSSSDSHALFLAAGDLYRVAADGSSAPTLIAPPSVAGEVQWDVRDSADGTSVVFRAQSTGLIDPPIYMLCRARADGTGTSVVLSGSLFELRTVRDFQLTPDGSRAVYLAQWGSAQSALFSVPLDQSSPRVQISPASGAGSTVSDGALGGDYLVSSDGTRVVYRADADETCELYSVPIAGGTVVRLNDPLVVGGDVARGFELADGFVYYRADALVDGRVELFRAPIDGSSAPVKLDATPVAGGSVEEFHVSANGARVVYRADQDADEVFDLYSVPADGSAAPIRLNVSSASADVEPDFEIAADNLGVAYRADQDHDGVIELYTVGILGGPTTRRSGGMVPGGDVLAFHVSVPTLRLVFLADRRKDGVDELFSTSISSGAPVALSPALAADRDVDDFALSPDGTSVVFRADVAADDQYELFAAPVDGHAAATQLQSIHAAGGRVEEFTFASGGARVLYRASQESLAAELFGVPLDASSAPVRLNGATVTGAVQEQISGFRVAPHADRVAYRGMGTDPGQLYTVAGNGRGRAAILTPYLFLNGFVESFDFTPDGSRLVFSIAGLALSAPSDGSGPPACLGRGKVLGIGPDGARVALRRGADLYVARLDEDPVRLNDASEPLPPYDDIQLCEFTPDGSQVVYVTGDVCSSCVDVLHRVPSDRSQAPVVLASGIGAYSFHVSPDGARVVFQSGKNLFSVPLDGSSSPVQLNGALVANGSVRSFEIGPDATRVAYGADANVQGKVELFSVPIDGSNAPLLVGPQTTSSVLEFHFTPDSNWIVSRAPKGSFGKNSVWSVPSDGSAPRIELNPTLSSQQSVRSFAISPDSRRVVFSGNVLGDTGHVHLMSVPVDRSLEPVRLNADLHDDGSNAAAGVSSGFQVSPDGRYAAYRADQNAVGRFELFLAPLDGSAPPLQLNVPFIPPGDVDLAFLFSRVSGRVFYVADANVDAVEELFSTAFVEAALPHVHEGDGHGVPTVTR